LPRLQAIVAGVAQAEGAQVQSVVLTESQLAFIDWDAMWLELEEYRRVRGLTHVVIDRGGLPELFAVQGWYELLLPTQQQTLSWENVAVWKRVVLELLKRYLEAFHKFYEQAFFEPRLELRELARDDENLQVASYLLSWETQLQTGADQVMQDLDALEQEINTAQQAILASGQFAKLEATLAKPQLLKPLLHLKAGSKLTVTPQPLNDSEFGFVRDLNTYLEIKPTLLQGAEVFLLRNKSKGGIGFFEAGAFYPDFILWVLKGGTQFVAFVEPHGLRNETPHTLKMQFYTTIKGIEKRVNNGRTEHIRLESFIVSPTAINELKWGEGWKTMDEFAAHHVLFMQDAKYVERMFNKLLLP
jgi:hypothetical protein